MGTYIFSIAALALLSSIICILCPEKCVKYVSFIASLAVMLVIISPLKNVSNITVTTPSIENEIAQTDLKEAASSALAQSVAEALKGKYGKEGTIKNITITTAETDEFKVENIIVTVTPSLGITDYPSAGKYLSELYGVDITVNEG